MTDQHGEQLLKWKADYAQRAGGGRAMCKDTDCLERYEQGGEKFIEKGALRIGRRVLMKGRGGDDDEGQVSMMWYHARCMFNCFCRARKDTRVIQYPQDIEGFAYLDPADQDMLRKFIANNSEIRGWAGRGGGVGGAKGIGGGAGPRGVPPPPAPVGEKRRPMDFDMTPAKVARIAAPNDVKLKVGKCVWTFFRCKPPVVPGAPAVAATFAVKSPRPELGMIVEEEKEGCFVIQFESAEHERDRMEMYANPKKRKIKGWLRYPRIFEGKKQKIQIAWIQQSRKPPRLCGCTRQEWGHGCDTCGISCSRGASRKVWGIADD